MAPGIAEKKNNNLPLWGNEKTMNLNNLILTNILSSHYFKVNLYQLKTYHEVIDEIYYQVNHLEPWEKGSRKTSGQTGMCGGVRGVGAGGIVSTAFCILYKLFTLKLTRKQLVGLINHADSPYIRALGFMYIRYTQPPSDLWDWYEPYLNDDEEIDVKAGSGQTMTIGEMLQHYLSKLEWFSTLFPRIPVPIQKDLERKLSNWRAQPENRSFVSSQATENTENSEQQVAFQESEQESRPDRRRESRDRMASSENSPRDWDKRSNVSRSHRHEHHRDKHRSRSPHRSSESRSTREESDKRQDKKYHRKDRERSYDHNQRSSSSTSHPKDGRHHDRKHESHSSHNHSGRHEKVTHSSRGHAY